MWKRGFSRYGDMQEILDPVLRFFSGRQVAGAIVMLDLIVIAAAFSGTHAVYDSNSKQLFGAVELNAAVLFVVLGLIRGLYHPRVLLARNAQLIGVWSGWLLASVLTLVLVLLSDIPNPFSLASTVAIVITAPALLLSARMLLNEMIRRSAPSGALGMTRAVVVGDPEELASLSQRDLRQHYGIEQVARFAFRGSSVDPRLVVGIIEAIRMHRAEQVIVVLPWHDRRRIDMLIDQMRALPTPIVLIADSRTRAIALEARAGERPAFTVELQKAPLTRTEAAVKRLFDIVASAAILWLLLPVFLLIAISVRVESAGPVVFRQRRHGFNGAEFKIRKFRTMRVLEDGPTIVQTRANDLRVTRVGRILRRSSLDELPQLMNVLVGDMSLIGPRPHAVAHDRQFSALVSNYASRFRIKPGMTGWAQINGFRGETPQIGLMQKRIDLDLWYIDNWSLWLDLKILVLTFREVLRGRHAF